MRRHWWIRQFRRWHRWLGICAALWLLVLVVTGWLVNHADDLHLARQQWSAAWLTRWYGIRAEVPGQGFLANTHWLAGNQEAWLLDGKRLDVKGERPVGLVRAGKLLVAASNRRLRLYAFDAQLIDEIDATSLPLPEVQRIGVSDDSIVVAADRALESKDGLDWRPFAGQPVWSAPRPIPESLRRAWAAEFRASIPAERVLLDIHSGRILGRGGPWLLDGIGVVLVALALSGAWLFFRRH